MEELSIAPMLQAAPWADLSPPSDFHADFVELESHLSSQPRWVRNAIWNLLREERDRSLVNVAGQVAAFRDIVAKLMEINRSEEAASLRHLLKDVPICSVRALDTRAHAISKDVAQLHECAREGDLARMEGLARRIASRATNFKRKFAELRPKLERLAAEVEKVARMCQKSGQASQELLQQTQGRRDWWFWLFDLIGKSAAWTSGAVLAGSVGSLCYLGYLYQTKAVAMGAAKATYATAKKLVTEKAASAHVAAAQADAAKATAAARAADVASANHALQSATGAEVATTGASAHAGPKAVLTSLGLAGILDIFLMHGVDVAVAASDAASAAASAASASAAAAHMAMSTAASQAAAATASVNSLQVAIGSLSTSMVSVAPIAALSGVVLALCMLGYAGRHVLKRMLGKLWAEEIEHHERTSTGFQHMAGHLQEALAKLRATCSSNEKLEEAFAVVAEAAEELADEAECCQFYVDEGVAEDDFATLGLQVAKLESSCQEAAAAFGEMQLSLREVSEDRVINRFLIHDLKESAPIGNQLALEPGALEVPGATALGNATSADAELVPIPSGACQEELDLQVLLSSVFCGAFRLFFHAKASHSYAIRGTFLFLSPSFSLNASAVALWLVGTLPF